MLYIVTHNVHHSIDGEDNGDGDDDYAEDGIDDTEGRNNGEVTERSSDNDDNGKPDVWLDNLLYIEAHNMPSLHHSLFAFMGPLVNIDVSLLR